MSHIPRLFNNVYRRSDAAKSKKTYSASSTARQDTANLFKVAPTIQMLQARELPNEIRGRPRIVGNSDHVEILCNYTRNLSGILFHPSMTSVLFPNELSLLRQSVTRSYQKSKSTAKSSLIPDFSSELNRKVVVNLSNAFEKLKLIMKNNTKQIIAICDFCILYCGIIILLCDTDENEENKRNALHFLKQLFRLEIPQRTYEVSILFAILVKQGNSKPTIRGHSIQVLALMAEMDQLISQRLKAGLNHKDQVLASLCQDALSLMNKSDESIEILSINQFQEIPIDSSESVVEETLTNYERLINNGSIPIDILKFIRNIIQIIKRYSDSPLIVKKGVFCIHQNILSCRNIPLEMISEILILCFSILSGENHFNGSDEGSYDTLEAIKNLTDNIFSNINPDILLSGIAASISTSSDLVTNLILERLNEYLKLSSENVFQKQLDDIISITDAFHPDVTLPFFLSQRRRTFNTFANMSLSIERLLNPDTVFQEMEEIISKKDPRIIENYPHYLKGFLQRAYCLYNEEEIPSMSENQRALVNSMISDYHSIRKADLINDGKFSIRTLQNSYNELIKPQTESW